MEIFKRLEAETNVKIEWENIPDTDFAEKKNFFAGQRQLTGCFYGAGFSDYELVNYGEDGTILPLEDLIDQYAPNLKALLDRRPDIKSSITAPDGHIYGRLRGKRTTLERIPSFTLSIKVARQPRAENAADSG